MPITFRRTVALLLLAVAGCAGPELDDNASGTAGAEPVVAEQGMAAAPEIANDTLGGDWTLEPTRHEATATRSITLAEVRVANHAAFDRFVIEFEGGAFPSYDVEYTEGGIQQCGSGEAVEMEAAAILRVRLQPARAHDDGGNATLDARSWLPAMPAIREAEVMCDFEAVVEIAVGVAAQNRYRLTTLTNPHRLAIDIRH